MDFICFGLVLIVIASFIVPLFKWWVVNNHLVKARSKYFDALEKLRQMPNNTSLKQHTFTLGQNYVNLTQEIIDSNVTQKVKGFIPYDELTLMSDINDVCEGGKDTSDKEITNTQIIEERLAKLSELKEKNLISEQEYEQRRQKILDEI